MEHQGEVEARRHGDVVVIVVRGTYWGPELTAAAAAALSEGVRLVVINLEGATYVDPDSLAAIIQALKTCRERGGDLRLCHPVIGQRGTCFPVIPIHPSEQEATRGKSDPPRRGKRAFLR